jgi:hypothetical protein
LSAQGLLSVILGIFNRGSSVFAFSFAREENDSGFPIKPGMTESYQWSANAWTHTKITEHEVTSGHHETHPVADARESMFEFF